MPTPKTPTPKTPTRYARAPRVHLVDPHPHWFPWSHEPSTTPRSTAPTNPDIVLFDLHAGPTRIQHLQHQYPHALLIGCTPDHHLEAQAFTWGVHDVLRTPTTHATLQHRIHTWHHTPPPPNPRTLTLHANRTITTPSGHTTRLSKREHALLTTLAQHPHTPLDRTTLKTHAWNQPTLTHRAVDTRIATLRRKLDPHTHDPTYIATIHGRGYALVADVRVVALR